MEFAFVKTVSGLSNEHNGGCNDNYEGRQSKKTIQNSCKKMPVFNDFFLLVCILVTYILGQSLNPKNRLLFPEELAKTSYYHPKTNGKLLYNMP